jgi:endonuclease/exonuclease/phosphatase family metal-dependent hydrolase
MFTRTYALALALFAAAVPGCLAPTAESAESDDLKAAPPATTTAPTRPGVDPAAPSYDWNQPAGAGLRIGSWKIKRLGHSTTTRYDLVAQIIDAQFDVVALQEVMTTEAIDTLLAHLPGWSAELSEHAVGRKGYYEYYAVLYRTAETTVTRAYLVQDPDDQLMREPLVACLRTGASDYCLVDVHVNYGDVVADRDQEIHALGNLVAKLRDAGPEKDWIVLGDFNRQGSAASFSALAKHGWGFDDNGAVKSTLGVTAYANPYDHALLDARYSAEWTGAAGRYDMVASPCGGDFAFCTTYVSDHAPIGLMWNASGADDD